MENVCFNCTNCGSPFPVVLEEDTFTCPHCDSRYQLTHVNHELCWMPAVSGPAWQTREIHPVTNQFSFYIADGEPESNLGLARTRRLRRQQRHARARSDRLALMSLFLIGFLLALPIVAPNIQMNALAAEILTGDRTPTSTGLSENMSADPLADLAGQFVEPSPTSRPTQTATPTMTPTQTPLPPIMVTATAWQDMFNNEVAESYARQTENAVEYFATQTALPPTLTVMAVEREIRTTETAQAKR
jgi:hypothetical protein